MCVRERERERKRDASTQERRRGIRKGKRREAFLALCNLRCNLTPPSSPLLSVREGERGKERELFLLCILQYAATVLAAATGGNRRGLRCDQKCLGAKSQVCIRKVAKSRKFLGLLPICFLNFAHVELFFRIDALPFYHIIARKITSGNNKKFGLNAISQNRKNCDFCRHVVALMERCSSALCNGISAPPPR